jgi:solute carrier family 25 (mitochondrial citrate transporter), member 1
MIEFFYNFLLYVSMSHACAGIRGTYQGLTATMLKQGTNQAIRFFVMESLKEVYRGKDDVNKPVPKLITGMFGVVAGAASVFGNTPLDVIKTRMQVILLIET